ncbi:DUF421 domain-containing protein [Wukongibacter baidiensis]|uniref:DUF421 domain-containing protein n=1 Tax=Wukongibacter baidiensis TaxID=1723361 RepID=UPI003D7FBD62
MPFILKPIVLYIIAVILLRLTGRRSISQMTISQTVLVLSLGHIIVEPFADKDIKKTIAVAVILAILLILFEAVEFYSKGFEKIAVGQEKIIVTDGIIDEKNMKKLRLTKDELYSRLRQKGISKIEDVKKATLETNGELGFELTKAAQPITVEDMEFILNKVIDRQNNLGEYINLVEELKKKDK